MPLGWNLSISDDPTSTPICESIGGPFVERHNFDGKECKMERAVSGGLVAGSETGQKEKKKRFYCVSPMIFSESKWESDGEKKGGCSEARERINQEKLSHQAAESQAEPLGRWKNTAFLPDTTQQTTTGTERVGVCVCSDSQSESRAYSLTFLHAPQKRSLVSVKETVLNRPQGALAAAFCSEARGQYGRQWSKGKKWKARSTRG